MDLIFQALSDGTRRAILREVARREMTVTEIAKPYGMSLAAVSKHLKVLERARLLERRRAGSFQLVKLNAVALQNAEKWIADYEEFWRKANT